jgi:hypothetical protein
MVSNIIIKEKENKRNKNLKKKKKSGRVLMWLATPKGECLVGVVQPFLHSVALYISSKISQILAKKPTFVSTLATHF